MNGPEKIRMGHAHRVKADCRVWMCCHPEREGRDDGVATPVNKNPVLGCKGASVKKSPDAKKGAGLQKGEQSEQMMFII
ncbi:hypothetical protein KTH_55730 [Thermosporothrix hazakensis]|nr:hypothetical protein KTH_55730 [Thermosporothrix hazakensis]